MNAERIVKVGDPNVSCGGSSTSHPKVYMKIGESGEVTCKYCGKRFILSKSEQQSL